MDQTFMREVVKANPDRVYFPNLGIFENGIKLNRVMFTIPGTDIDIYWYGFLIALGIVLAMVYCFRRMKSFGISPDIATEDLWELFSEQEFTISFSASTDLKQKQALLTGKK